MDRTNLPRTEAKGTRKRTFMARGDRTKRTPPPPIPKRGSIAKGPARPSSVSWDSHRSNDRRAKFSERKAGYVGVKQTSLVRMIPPFTAMAPYPRNLFVDSSDRHRSHHTLASVLACPFAECPIDGRTPNSKRLGNGRGADALLFELPHP
jgi:hypothetical protein